MGQGHSSPTLPSIRVKEQHIVLTWHSVLPPSPNLSHPLEDPWDIGCRQEPLAKEPVCCRPRGYGCGGHSRGSGPPCPAGGCGDCVPCIYHPVPGRDGHHRVQVEQRLPLGLGESLLPVLPTLPPHRSCACSDCPFPIRLHELPASQGPW